MNIDIQNTCSYQDILILKQHDQIRQWVAKGRPFIIRNYCPDICAYGVDYLREYYSDRSVLMFDKTEYQEASDTLVDHHQDVDIGAYLKSIKEGRTELYLAQSDIEDTFPKLRDKLPLKECDSFGVECVTNCWVGPAGTKSILHYDADQNFLIQAQGRKRVNLISPDYSEYLYPKSLSFYDGFSHVDTYNPDYDKYPLFKNVVILEGTIFPGDVLFIPSKWWHDIRSLDISVSYNIWWMYKLVLAKYILKETIYRIKGALGLVDPLDAKQSFYSVAFDRIFSRRS